MREKSQRKNSASTLYETRAASQNGYEMRNQPIDKNVFKKSLIISRFFAGVQ